MHELLATLFYILEVDLKCLSEIYKHYEDQQI